MLRTLRGCAGGGFCCCQRRTSSSMRCTFSFASLSSSMAARISKSRCVGSSLIGPPSVGCRNPNLRPSTHLRPPVVHGEVLRWDVCEDVVLEGDVLLLREGPFPRPAP